MIILKTARELELLQEAGRISAEALRIGGAMLHDGVTTAHVDDAMREYIQSQGAEPSFLGYNGYPKTANISINDQVIHGIPDTKTVVRNGDVVSIDVGAMYKGFHGDNAATFAVGEISSEARRLMDATAEALQRAIDIARPGNRIGDISHAVQSYIESQGFSVIRDFVGHGVGRKLHEEPEVPNFGKPGHGPRLMPGMVIAIEPMVAAGSYKVKILPDGWTVVTADASLAAHAEHTIAITDRGALVLTAQRR